MDNEMDELISALESFKKAKKAYKKALKNCTEDADYFLRDELEAIEQSRGKLKEAFKNAVLTIKV